MMPEDTSMIEGVADELMKAFETKDKALMVDAMRALILHIQAEDEKQDQGE